MDFGKNLRGSPPPMRGKVAMLAKLIGKKGITPAYAGKSRMDGRNSNGERDHPRLCGEKLVTETFSHSPLGSPPPMRGKGVKVNTAVRLAGITPAYAGKRCQS